MKKVDPTPSLGGAPYYKSDFREVFNDELWDVLEGMLSAYQTHTEGVIISGCVVTPNASNFDMSAGIVYLNGEYMRVDAVTNQAFPKFIIAGTPINDTRTFADATSHVAFVTAWAGLTVSAPGAGQYISITSLTSAEDRRLYRLNYDCLQFIIDGGGTTITTGQKGHVVIPYNCTVVGVTLLGDTAASVVIDLWRDTYASYPPTVADSVCAAAKPTLSSATKSQDTTLTGWTKDWNRGDVLAYNVDSVSGLSRVTVFLEIKRR